MTKKQKLIFECPLCEKKVPEEQIKYGICDECEKNGYWMDPIGGIHKEGDDPAAMYV